VGTVSKKLNRKGQFTLFVIVALVVLFSFAFLIYAKNKIVSARMTNQADRQIREYIDKYAIEQYVTSCLDIVSQEVILRAEGGGRLHFNETTDAEDETYIEFNDTNINRTLNVSIVISVNDNCPDGKQSVVYNGEPNYNGIPDYPYLGGYARIVELESKYYNTSSTGINPKNICRSYEFPQYSGFFGINNLTRLCNSNGANKASIVSGNSLTCDYYNNYNKSLQQAIELEIEKEIANCVNFSEIKSRSAGNSNITNIGNATAILTFKASGYNVKIIYPFTVIMSNKQPITRMVNFGIDRDSPFKELYEYTYELLNYDVKYSDFSITKNYTNVLSRVFNGRRTGQNIRLYNYSVDVKKGDNTNNYTDVARIIDNDHKIKGYPLMIYIAIKERRPVLDFLHKTSSTSSYDITAIENNKTLLNPKGYDPDDDIITYKYTGWLEEYTEKYDENKDHYCKDPKNLDDIKNCMQQTQDFSQKNWTKSDEYQKTEQNASYTPVKDDKGYHEIVITTTDEHGLIDSQTVKILVFDLPTAVITLQKAYPDIEPGFASYEDKFIISGGDSTVGFISHALQESELVKFTWEDKIEEFTIVKEDVTNPDNKDLNLPQDDARLNGDMSNVDMKNIVGYAFEIKQTPLPAIQKHTISLTVEEKYGATATKTQEVNVTPCLNHENPFNPSYPYNKDPYSPDDSFNADHTCCTNDKTYATRGTSCFTSAQYGRISSFTDYENTVGNEIENPLPFGSYGTYEEYSDYYNNYFTENDIYEQTFVRYCSGDRGNICSGDGINTITVVNNGCEDYNYNTYDGTGSYTPNYERCSGPQQGYLYDYSTSPLSCENYPAGTTFESLMGIGTGYCNSERACNDNNQFCYGVCSDGRCELESDCRCDSSECGTDDKCDIYGSEWNPICADGEFVEKTCSQCMLNTIYEEDRCGFKSNNCNVADECQGKYFYDSIDINRGCDSTCQIIDCETGNYNPVLQGCE
jgi:hypothetical protein